jgi:MoaA/NifB/PqqE/SkfB family radical SAM enzyme
MANLTISAVCNQSCAYCFTSDYVGDCKSSQRFLDLADFEARLDFLDRSGIDQARLLGGEPTLHPQFPELVGQARARNKRVVVFTNGLMPEKALAGLEQLAATDCTVLMNVNEPENGTDTLERQRTALRRLGKKAQLGFNIYRPDFQPEFLLALIAETGCKPAIRLGLAQPCLSGDNRHILPNQYVAIGAKVVRFARVAADAGVIVEFDCGFMRCMFSDQDVETLKTLGADVGWRCNPILDVSIEGQVIHCYPLSRLGSLPLTPGTDAPALRNAFESRTRPFRQAGVFQECSICPFKSSGERAASLEECPGGCLAVTIRRFRHTPFSLVVPHHEARA